MITQTATMLKFTPTFHPPHSSIIKKPQTHFTNFPNINITTNRPFHITSFPKICMTNNKLFHISSRKNDQILFRHNGKEIVGVVQHVVRHKNLKISGNDVYSHTFLDEEGKEKMWSISTTMECKDGDVEKMKKEIKDIQNANHELKYTTFCRITVSKLKTPHFEHYMELRKKVFSEIDEIRIKHEGSLERIEFEYIWGQPWFILVRQHQGILLMVYLA
ncbi:hypothetical protein MKW92_048911 [Papaver armeniacum]|nr:hypothetical protein MKW92_048911 [Papaver armeniacum]